ncbi:hypothetical protein [Actinomadura litoris]|uniref:hypothetical protein n=1 Tax=Actinomadura litoris TaxID=2678616 RepID=UPI001FA6B69D|nr:hypothetical protein [Actinomadura litoris]
MSARNGEPFVVLGEQGRWSRLEYSGRDVSVAERMGLGPFDRGVDRAWAAQDEVEDVARRSFGPLAGADQSARGRRW